MSPRRWPAVVALFVTALALACTPPRHQAAPCNDDSECAVGESCTQGLCGANDAVPTRGDDGGRRDDDDAGADKRDAGHDADGAVTEDAAGTDAGLGDAGGRDNGADGGNLDAGSIDAGAVLDAGRLDAGPAAQDAGVDAGAHDVDDVLPNVTGLAGYSVVYRVQIPSSGARFNFTNAPYAFDGSAALDADFTRVGYYLELQEAEGPLYFVYVEADALSTDVRKIGVPTTASGALYQSPLSNTRVESNHPAVTAGRGHALNVEFWPSDYVCNNDSAPLSPPAADDLVYDFGDGDASTSAGHGSMQIHNSGEGRTLFAFNDWGGDHPGDPLELGIGNQPTAEPDWTHADNAGAYTLKSLSVVVNAPIATPAMPPDLPGPPLDVTARVSAEELSGYRLVYALDLPEVAAFNGSDVPYSVDNSALVPAGSFDRVAYFLELEDTSGVVQWVWVSVAAFTLDAAKLGVPARGTGVHLQHTLEEGRVFSNVVPEGSGLTTLNMEFWSTNYQAANALPVAGASDSLFDFGDRPSAGGYGSMQIHDAALATTLFAYNHWGAADTPSDLGIGNSPSGNPDWTFRQNSLDYVTRRLMVLVHER